MRSQIGPIKFSRHNWKYQKKQKSGATKQKHYDMILSVLPLLKIDLAHNLLAIRSHKSKPIFYQLLNGWPSTNFI